MANDGGPVDVAAVDRVLKTTRSVRRRLDLERPVPEALIEEAIDVALQAPTGGNTQEWRFVVVTDAGLRAKLADVYRKGSELLICYDERNTHQAVPLLPVMKELTVRYPGLFEAEPWRGGRACGDYALAIELLAQGRIDVESYVTRIVDWQEIDRVVELGFDRLPDREVKVRLRMVP